MELITGIILLAFSVANGIFGRMTNKEGKSGWFSLFVCGWCGYAAIITLIRYFIASSL